MTPDFWKERWTSNQIGFHEGKPNEHLTRYWDTLGVAAGGRVFVPLCGKSLDMAWLAGRGHSVLGVELSEIAVRDFFAEAGITPTREHRNGFEISKAGDIEIWCGDFFTLQPHHLAGFAAVYDRASLVAMPPDMQTAYTAKMLEIVPKTAPTLLITLEYDQREMAGPPFSVPVARVRELFGGHCRTTELDRQDALPSHSNFSVRGLSRADTLTMRLVRL